MRQQQLKEDISAIAKSKVRIRPGSETEPDVSLVSATESGIMSLCASPLKSRSCGEGCAEGQNRRNTNLSENPHHRHLLADMAREE